MSLRGVKLRRINDTEDVGDFFRWLEQPREILCIDTETIGLSWHEPNFTRLVQFGDHETGWTINVQHWWGVINEALRKYDRPMMAWNLKFDQHALDAAGFPTIPRHLAEDGYLMHALLYPLKWHGLKPVSAELLDRHANIPSKKLDALMKAEGWTWATVPYECMGYSVYGALDTVLGARLYTILKPQIDARFPAAYEREMMTSHIMFETERRGLRIDLDYTQRLDTRYRTEMEDLLTKIQFLGVQNPNSGRQIEKALRLDSWEPAAFTGTGAPSLKKAVLQGLDHELAQLILEYRWREKFSSYTEKILRTHSGGRVFPSINTFEARTGRMSIGSDKRERGTGEVVSVPWQQIPSDYNVRRCVLPNDDHDLWAIDYSSQELRIEAHLSQDPGLIAAINSERDMHLNTASQMFGEDITDKDDPRRSIAKMTAYLIIYGGGADKLAGSAGVSEYEAQHMIDLFKQAFPGVDRYNKSVISAGRSRAQREGRAYIETWGGRECEADPDFAYRLTNYVVQGSCSDLLKEKLIALDAAGFTPHMLLPVHDEVVWSFPKDEPDMAHEAAQIMQELRAFSVPLTVDITGPKQSWGHAKLKRGEIPWDEV